MGNCKVCVYTICKNEEKFVDRWMDSMGEADLVVVLDTGSKDGTVERLRARGAQVTVERILPWRFDAARNRSLELVPEDVDLCVCTDLDEVFHPGWREALERAWRPGCGRVSYRYTWSFQQDGSEGLYSGAIRSTPAGATGGSTRYTRCSSGRGRAPGAHCGGGGGPAGPPPGSGKIPGTVPASSGAVCGGGPGG